MRKVTVPIPEVLDDDGADYRGEKPSVSFAVHFSHDSDESRAAFKEYVDRLEADGYDTPARFFDDPPTRVMVEVKLAAGLADNLILEVYGPPVVKQPDRTKGPMAMLNERIAEAALKGESVHLHRVEKEDEDGPGS